MESASDDDCVHMVATVSFFGEVLRTVLHSFCVSTSVMRTKNNLKIDNCHTFFGY